MKNYGEMSIEELERILPLEIARREETLRFCGSSCPLGASMQNIHYERCLICSERSNGLGRLYVLAYKVGGRTLYETYPHLSLRDALIELCRILAESGEISVDETEEENDVMY